MRIIYWMFLLSVLLLVLVYYKGATTFSLAFTSGARALIYAVTGRDENGRFQPYPGGA
jgi:hypothetical protein